MSEFFAEATILIRPDVTGFARELERLVREEIKKVERTTAARITISPKLTRNFISDLRNQLNSAIASAQKGVKPISLKAKVEDVTEAAAKTARKTQERATKPPIVGLVSETTATTDLAEARETLSEVTPRVTAAERELFKAMRQVGISERLNLGQSLRAAQIRKAMVALTTAMEVADEQAAVARALLTEEVSDAVRKQAALLGVTQANARASIDAAEAVAAQAAAVREQLSIIEQDSAALREQDRAARRAAAAQSQLRRGMLATSLSFLNIRGATLAATRNFLLGAAAVAIFAKAITTASAFSNQLNIFRATAGATEQEMDRVRKAAVALGQDITLPAVTSADAAEAMVELAKAGLSTQDAMDAARGVLQLATAAAINNAQAVELTANALNAFGLSGKEATAVADTFANAANLAQGSIVDIGVAFRQAAAAGRQVGLSFQDTATFLTILQREGIRGSDAGTALRTALIRLVRPTEKAAEMLRKMGIQVRDTQGRLRTDIFQQIGNVLRELSPAARDAAIALLGGQDAFRAIAILSRQPIDQLMRLREELRKEGTAAELAAAHSRGLSGAMDALSSTLETVGVRFGRAVSPGIIRTVRSLTALIQRLNESETASIAFAQTQDFMGTIINTSASILGRVVQVGANVASVFTRMVDALGVQTILTATLAYASLSKVIRDVSLGLAALGGAAIGQLPILGRLTQRILLLGQGIMLLLSADMAGRRLQLLGTALGSLLRSTTIVTTGIGLLAGGLVYLATRENQTERATRRLREAFDELVAVQAAGAATSERVFSARQSVEAAQTAVQTAILEQRRAQAALAASTAPRTSVAFLQLQNNLRIATQNVTFAVRAQRKAMNELAQAQEEAFFQGDRLKEAINETTSRLREQVEEVSRRTARIGRGRVPFGVRMDEDERQLRIRQAVSEFLRQEADLLRSSEEASKRALGVRLALLSQLATQMRTLPTMKEIRVLISTPNLRDVLRQLAPRFGIEGTRASQIFVQRVVAYLSSGKRIEAAIRLALADVPVLMAAEGSKSGDAFMRAAAAQIEASAPIIQTATTNVAKRAAGRLAGLQREALDIIIRGGTDAERLANLRRQEEMARRRFEALRPGPAKWRAKEELASIVQERRALEEEMAREAEQKREEAEQRQRDLDEKLLEMLGFRRERAEERILDARVRDSLFAQLRAVRKLRSLVRQQIEIVRERVKTAEVRIRELRILRRTLRDLARQELELRIQRQEEIREQQRRRQELIIEAARLDIEFFSIVEQKRNEILARQRLISLYQRELTQLNRLRKLTQEQINRRKQLRNDIARERQEIKRLRGELRASSQDASQFFLFLQRQQGFVANLLGNLIPSGATAGLVGPVGPNVAGRGRLRETMEAARGFGGGLAASLIRERELSEARRRGPTEGQLSTLIAINREALRVLKLIAGDTKHPEVRRSRMTTRAALDLMG